MSTNFYLIPEPCGECGFVDRLHIGKRSAGWAFLFRGYAEEILYGHDGRRAAIRSAADWGDVITHVIAHGGIITDGVDPVTVSEFWTMIRTRGSLPTPEPDMGMPAKKQWLDEEGHRFYAWEFS